MDTHPKQKQQHKRSLTAQQERFVNEYLVDLNARQAAIRAGYSKRTAQVLASQLLARPAIQAAISAAKARRQRRTEVTQDRVIEELACVAFSRIDHVAAWGPRGVQLRAPEEIGEAAAASVESLSETEGKAGGSTRIKLHNKVRALELLLAHTTEGRRDGDGGEYERVLDALTDSAWAGHSEEMEQ